MHGEELNTTANSCTTIPIHTTDICSLRTWLGTETEFLPGESTLAISEFVQIYSWPLLKSVRMDIWTNQDASGLN